MKTPGTGTLEELFAGRPAALRLFSSVRAFITALGPVETRVTKTQVSFRARTGFAWVWLPQLWIRKQPEESIVLSFDLRRRIADPRVKQVVEPRPGRFMHHVVIRQEADFDDEVRGWLRVAYDEHR
jgi:hypothetical protein